MSNFRIRGTRVALRFGSGVGYGPCGAVGQMRVESSGFRRKTEVSTPLLYYRASLTGRRFGGRSVAENVKLPVPLCPLGQVFRHRSGCGDAECLAGRCDIHKIGGLHILSTIHLHANPKKYNTKY